VEYTSFLLNFFKEFSTYFSSNIQSKFAGKIKILCMFLVCIIPEVYKFRKQGKRRFLRSLTPKAKRIWRFAGVFTVALRQGECGRNTAEMHVSQPMCLGVCYVLAAWLTIVCSFCSSFALFISVFNSLYLIGSVNLFNELRVIEL
jgi:hypothetical protein